MKKHHVVILGIILAALGALLFALLPLTANLVIAYAFYLAAIVLLVLGVWTLGAKGKSLLMEWPLFLKTRDYLIVTVAISALVLLLDNLNVFKVPFGLHLLVQAAAALILGLQAVKLLMGKTHIEETGKQAGQAHQLFAGMTADVNALKSKVSGMPEEAWAQVAKALERVSDALRYSDPIGTPETASLEQDMIRDVVSLGRAVAAFKADETLSLAAQLEAEIRERNERNRLSKK